MNIKINDTGLFKNRNTFEMLVVQNIFQILKAKNIMLKKVRLKKTCSHVGIEYG
jgi:hypothetical protein